MKKYKFTNEIIETLKKSNFRANKKGTSFYLHITKKLVIRLSNHKNFRQQANETILNFCIRDTNDLKNVLEKLNKKFKKLNLITTL